MRRIPGLLALLIVLVLSFFSLPAMAQDALGGEGRSAPSALPANLDDALERVTWDAARRGPLLVVDPKHTPPAANVPLPPSAGSRLRDVASRFGRKVVALSSLTVLAPTEMVVLNTRPGKPNPLAGLDRAEIAHYLMALRSPSQWQKLGSTDGLGLADLSREQQLAFDALVPTPLVVRKAVAGKFGGVRFVEGGETRLPDGARTGVRLRVMRAVSLRVPSARDKTFSEVNSRINRPESAELTTVQTPAWDPAEQRSEAQGVSLKGAESAGTGAGAAAVAAASRERLRAGQGSGGPPARCQHPGRELCRVLPAPGACHQPHPLGPGAGLGARRSAQDSDCAEGVGSGRGRHSRPGRHDPDRHRPAPLWQSGGYQLSRW